MKILVANLGSTSFKFRLFDMTTEAQIARGGIDRIGGEQSECVISIGKFEVRSQDHVGDHAAAVEKCFTALTDVDTGCLASVSEVSAIGFKAVFAGSMGGVRQVKETLLAKMESLAKAAPAHNPIYVKAMRGLLEAFPKLPMVAAFETGFHDTIPDHHRVYAVPYEWKTEHDVQRWGFHGASHRFIATRAAELLKRDDLKIISCHLGGSSSVCAIDSGRSVAASMGMSPQSGLPNNNRVGDFDAFALPVLMESTGKSLEALLDELANQSGLLGLSGISGDVRDLETAANEGNERAILALKTFEASIRSYVGNYMSLLGGADVVVFTGGIGENSQRIRAAVCERMEWAGLQFDSAKNEQVSGESPLSSDGSKVQAWVIPTNEELIVARQTAALLK
ncbi:MAG: acetate/propionate family kinase [Planctomycetaceae bacterium]